MIVSKWRANSRIQRDIVTHNTPRERRPQSNHFVCLVILTFHNKITGATASMISEMAAEAGTMISYTSRMKCLSISIDFRTHTSLNIAHDVSFKNIKVPWNHWIPENPYWPARHKDRKRHANINENVQHNKHPKAPLPEFVRGDAHQQERDRNLSSCFGSGCKLEGHPHELHGKHDIIWLKRRRMLS